MKQLLVLLFLSISVITYATNYYVKAAGNDTYTGLSDAQAWAHTSKVDAKGLVSGDTVFFKRGDIIYSDAIIYTEGGSVGNPVVFAAYGTGAKPIISGMGIVPGWSTSGNWTQNGNIWSISYSSIITRLWINGSEARRYPQQPPAQLS